MRKNNKIAFYYNNKKKKSKSKKKKEANKHCANWVRVDEDDVHKQLRQKYISKQTLITANGEQSMYYVYGSD